MRIEYSTRFLSLIEIIFGKNSSVYKSCLDGEDVYDAVKGFKRPHYKPGQALIARAELQVEQNKYLDKIESAKRECWMLYRKEVHPLFTRLRKDTALKKARKNTVNTAD